VKRKPILDAIQSDRHASDRDLSGNFRRCRLTEQELVGDYQAGASMRDLSVRAGISRQGVTLALKRLGISRTRRAGRVSAICVECGKAFDSRRRDKLSSAPRSEICGAICYSKQRAKTAVLSACRVLVSSHFNLLPHHYLVLSPNPALALSSPLTSPLSLTSLKAYDGKRLVWSGECCPCALCECIRTVPAGI